MLYGGRKLKTNDFRKLSSIFQDLADQNTKSEAFTSYWRFVLRRGERMVISHSRIGQENLSFTWVREPFL
jgi:hypothetical protein